MKRPEVYLTREITPASLVKIYEQLGVPAEGRVGVKISLGEPGNPNYLKPELIKENGAHILQYAAELGLGSREYELIEID